ncbi:MAG: type II toxin-antitoxin system Phd/YefM family antitoxin [Alphaproteobacteria bacterium]|nr:type II toxin-antitoxin system Phd/YefM family antitoxin [Alphaproteobacteria bacterium]
MNTWSVSEAKARLSEVLRLCQKEPQTITRRGVPVAMLVSVAEYLRLGGKASDLEEAGARKASSRKAR